MWIVWGFSAVLSQEVASLAVNQCWDQAVPEPTGLVLQMDISLVSEPYKQTVSPFAESLREASRKEPFFLEQVAISIL